MILPFQLNLKKIKLKLKIINFLRFRKEQTTNYTL